MERMRWIVLDNRVSQTDEVQWIKIIYSLFGEIAFSGGLFSSLG